MLTINDFAAALTADQLERIRRFPTAVLCDAMASLQVPRGGCLDGAISQVSGSKEIAGTAYTVATANGNTLPVQYAISQGRPGYILVVATGSYTDGPHLGDLNALTAQLSGLTGIVIDGYIRDVEEIRQLDYPVFARGCMPRQPGKSAQGEINTTITCASVRIAPGDIIVGDADGVVAIPQDLLEEVLQQAQKKEAADAERKALIEAFFKDNPGNSCHKDSTTLLPAKIRELL